MNECEYDKDLAIINHLKDFRKKNNLSQEELANALGLSRQSIIAIEQGRCTPSLPVAFSICDFFNTAFDEIFRIDKEISEAFDNMLNDGHKNINLIINEPKKDGSERKETMPSELEPWKPFREVVSLRDAMDRLFEDSVITPRGVAVMPKIDIKDKKDSIVVKAELPGMSEEEIDVEISDGVMTISGEKKGEEEKEGEGYYYRESHSGSFTRTFSLPQDIKGDKAEAEMKNGVLIITIPKVEPKKATKVKIKK